jgi:hypothetical protein
MRDHSLRVLALLLLPLTAAGQTAEVRVRIAPEGVLRPGGHAGIVVVVELPAGNDSPLLITPSVEGDAVEVVRGRLSRADGKAIAGAAGVWLKFEVPVVGRSEGTAILNVDVMTYVCADGCRRVVLRGSQVVRVRP